MGIPYLLSFIVFCLWSMLYAIATKTSFDWLNLIKCLLHQNRSSSPVFWLISCLFVCRLLIYCVERVGRIFKGVVYVILLGEGAAYITFIGVQLPWSVDAALIAFAFMLLGMYGKRFIERVRESKRRYRIWQAACTVVFAAVAVLCALYQKVDMMKNLYGNRAVFFAGALSGIGFTVLLCIWIENIPGMSNVFRFLGTRSIYIYCLHSLGISIAVMILGFLNAGLPQVGVVLFKAVGGISCGLLGALLLGKLGGVVSKRLL